MLPVESRKRLLLKMAIILSAAKDLITPEWNYCNPFIQP
jgi:hypothetical protein